MQTELFIHTGDSWKQVELLEDVSIPLNFNIADVKDFTKKNASFSKTIEIPGTKNNNILFKHLYNIGSLGSFEMGKLVPCYILDNNFLIFNGSFELTACIVSGYNKIINYEGNISSDTLTLLNTIGDKLLIGNEDPSDDIDFSEYNHILNGPNVAASMQTTPGSGYTYIPIDKTNHFYKTYSQAINWKLDELSPCLFIKEIWDKIFEKAGFTYESNFLNSERFKCLIYPHTDRWLYDTQENSDAHSAQVYLNDNVSVNLRPIPSSTVYKETTKNYLGTLKTQGNTNPYDQTTGIFTAKQDGYYNIKTAFIFQFLLQTGSGTPDIMKSTDDRNVRCSAVLIKEDNYGTITYLSTLFSVNRNLNEELQLTNGVYIIDTSSPVDIDLKKIFLKTGEKIYIRMYVRANLRIQPNSNYFWRNKQGTPIIVNFILKTFESDPGSYTAWNTELDRKITEGCIVPMSRVLHPIKQIDFVNSIIKMFNLYIEPTLLGKLKIEPRDSFYTTSTTTVDWTNKIDVDKEITIEPDLSYRESDILLTYKDDIDFFNVSYKSAVNKTYGEYSSYGENNKGKFEIKLIFSPTPGGNLCNMSSMQCPKIFVLKDDGVDETKKFNPRILYWKGLTQFKAGTGINEFWYILNNEGNIIADFYQLLYPYAGHFDNPYGQDTFDLNFGVCDWYWYDLNNTWATWNNIYNQYYQRLLEELKDSDTKLMKMSGILSAKDIQDLSFGNLIFIDGIYYRLNRISNFVPNRLCTLEFLLSRDYDIQYPEKYPIPDNPILPTDEYENPYNVQIDMIDANPNAINKAAYNLLKVDLFDGNIATAPHIMDIDVINARTDLYPPLIVSTTQVF